jgi:hypothetical protein
MVHLVSDHCLVYKECVCFAIRFRQKCLQTTTHTPYMRKTTTILILLVLLLNVVVQYSVQQLPIEECNPFISSPCGFANSYYFFNNALTRLQSVKTQEEATDTFHEINSDRNNMYKTPDGSFGVFIYNANTQVFVVHHVVDAIGQRVAQNDLMLSTIAPHYPETKWTAFSSSNLNDSMVGIVTQTTVAGNISLVIGASIYDDRMTIKSACDGSKASICSVFNTAAVLGATMAVMIKSQNASHLESIFDMINTSEEELYRTTGGFFAYVVEFDTNLIKVYPYVDTLNTLMETETVEVLKNAAEMNDHTWITNEDVIHFDKDDYAVEKRMSLNFKLELHGKKYLIGSGYGVESAEIENCDSSFYSNCAVQNAKTLIGNMFVDVSQTTTEEQFIELLNNASTDTTGRYQAISGGFYVFVVESTTGIRRVHFNPSLIGRKIQASVHEALDYASGSPYGTGVAEYPADALTQLTYVTRVTKFDTSYYIGCSHGSDIRHPDYEPKSNPNEMLFIAIALEAFAIVVTTIIAVTMGTLFVLERINQSREEKNRLREGLILGSL